MTEYEALNLYDEFLDDIYGDVNIAGIYYATSQALKATDPIAYRVGFNDWLDSEGIEIEE